MSAAQLDALAGIVAAARAGDAVALAWLATVIGQRLAGYRGARVHRAGRVARDVGAGSPNARSVDKGQPATRDCAPAGRLWPFLGFAAPTACDRRWLCTGRSPGGGARGVRMSPSPVSLVVARAIERWEQIAGAFAASAVHGANQSAGNQAAADALAGAHIELDRLRQLRPDLEAEAAAARKELADRWRRGWRGGAT